VDDRNNALHATYYRDTRERLLEDGVQMSLLIGQLLTLARTDAGVEILNKNSMNVVDLLKR
jgi:hypothetical protein